MIEALRSFFPSNPEGAVGSLNYPSEIRKKIAETESRDWKCMVCGKTNFELLPECDDDEENDPTKDGIEGLKGKEGMERCELVEGEKVTVTASSSEAQGSAQSSQVNPVVPGANSSTSTTGTVTVMSSSSVTAVNNNSNSVQSLNTGIIGTGVPAGNNNVMIGTSVPPVTGSAQTQGPPMQVAGQTPEQHQQAVNNWIQQQAQIIAQQMHQQHNWSMMANTSSHGIGVGHGGPVTSTTVNPPNYISHVTPVNNNIINAGPSSLINNQNPFYQQQQQQQVLTNPQQQVQPLNNVSPFQQIQSQQQVQQAQVVTRSVPQPTPGPKPPKPLTASVKVIEKTLLNPNFVEVLRMGSSFKQRYDREKNNNHNGTKGTNKSNSNFDFQPLVAIFKSLQDVDRKRRIEKKYLDALDAVLVLPSDSESEDAEGGKKGGLEDSASGSKSSTSSSEESESCVKTKNGESEPNSKKESIKAVATTVSSESQGDSVSTGKTNSSNSKSPDKNKSLDKNRSPDKKKSSPNKKKSSVTDKKKSDPTKVLVFLKQEIRRLKPSHDFANARRSNKRWFWAVDVGIVFFSLFVFYQLYVFKESGNYPGREALQKGVV